MRFLLDTVVLSELRKRERNPGVAQWIEAHRDTELFLSVVSIGEIERGIEMQRSRDADFAQRLGRWMGHLLTAYADHILPVTADIAQRWGRLSATLGNQGADLLLAATALEHDLTVITRNQRHFAPSGVRVENPWDQRPLPS